VNGTTTDCDENDRSILLGLFMVETYVAGKDNHRMIRIKLSQWTSVDLGILNPLPCPSSS
jgi:hypothetical protein